MDVTSDEIRSSRFQGSRHVYDRREVDAFLHRTAATLEMYERKLAVTEAHVQSLEKALDLAHDRARASRSRETRISELESALAAAQHNYESAMELLQAHSEAPQVPDVNDHELVMAARTRVEQLLRGAMEESARILAKSEKRAELAAETAATMLAAAEAEAEELRKEATLEHAAMLEELAKSRLDAKAALEEELDSKRSTALTELEAEKLRLAAETAAAQTTLESRLAEAEHNAAQSEERVLERLAAAEERAAAAEAEMARLLAELELAEAGAEREVGVSEERVLERLAAAEERAGAAEAEMARLLAEMERAEAAAEAERRVFTEDAERMFEEAVARAEADREAAVRQPAADVGDESRAEVAQLRRQVAQLRTALSGVQKRFSDISGLSAEELELSAMLAGLEAGDGDVIDLTTPATSSDDADSSDDPYSFDAPGSNVTVKSRWAEVQPMHAAARAPADAAVGGDNHDVPAPSGGTWRDAAGAARKNESDSAADAEQEAVIGFYERRLAGLRARLKDAGPDQT
jgi:hypothetical protein